ncbi:GDP-D-glucose phosphorylase 1 family protein [Thiohalobacter thiocyanaticus]|uniref:GDPGP1-like N-terminal domain-containing protein n=1 Tax=Thiohalobacter thiocyanaticus TaxID=585455 RepID=A0A426QHP1_9GAMM|nr:hypothetical protein [Thiohalobacter thiocyanaticus]RRQ21262.1 hypothetical protein D6C00_04370 [Thiohalobacter thiocyanaticus]
MTTADFLNGRDAFADAFTAGLKQLLQQEGLGPFILVLANATFDPDLYAELETSLRQRFEQLHDELRERFATGRDGEQIEEDLLVFLKMALIGFEGLQLTRFRDEGPWRLQFNHLRSFRPRRITSEVPKEIISPFNSRAFNFNKPFMQKECFWSGELLGRRMDLYYNKYPFAPLHGLWVLDRDAGKPQFLTREDHDYVWDLAADLGERIPGMLFGYNSYGAYASVNHLHVQGFVEPAGMPVMHADWSHHGGDTDYPARVFHFERREESWDCMAGLHADEQPYNALFTPGGSYLFPRRKQGTVEVPVWSSGLTWFELAGGFIVSNHQDFERLDAVALRQELERVRPE